MINLSKKYFTECLLCHSHCGYNGKQERRGQTLQRNSMLINALRATLMQLPHICKTSDNCQIIVVIKWISFLKQTKSNQANGYQNYKQESKYQNFGAPDNNPWLGITVPSCVQFWALTNDVPCFASSTHRIWHRTCQVKAMKKRIAWLLVDIWSQLQHWLQLLNLFRPYFSHL